VFEQQSSQGNVVPKRNEVGSLGHYMTRNYMKCTGQVVLLD